MILGDEIFWRLANDVHLLHDFVAEINQPREKS
jgi:hypothetical protein